MQVGINVEEQEFLNHTTLNPRVKVLCFGDSITQLGTDPYLLGWTSLLSQAYARRIDVVNRGLSGYNTTWALEALKHIIEEWKPNSPSLITIFFGANDAALENGNCRKQHVPVAIYKSNLETIIKSLREAFLGCKIILISPPPVNEDVRDARANAQTSLYAEACVQLAAETKVGIVNVSHL